jgi:MFS family permease
MSVGPVFIGIGAALFALIGPSGNYFTEVLPGVVVFGFGLAITVAPLTATVLAAAPAEHAGIASAVNNDVARAAALIAVALLPAAGGITSAAYRNPGMFSTGFHKATLIAAALCAASGVLAALIIRNEVPAPAAAEGPPPLHCALDAPPQALSDSTSGTPQVLGDSTSGT